MTGAAVPRFRRRVILGALAMAIGAGAVPAAPAAGPTPWMKDVAYDVHPLDTLDIYRPSGSYVDLPFVVFIHGGGWWNGDKADLPVADVAFFTGRGIAVVAINYRNVAAAADAHLFPPLRGPLEDAERALQFLRYHARGLALDPARAALWGVSAGAFDALWLGLAPDRADPAAADPLLRMSTRVAAIGAVDAQTSIDPAQMRAWVGQGLRYGGHAFGLDEKDFDGFLARRDRFKRWFPVLSPASLVWPGSPPLFLLYGGAIDDVSSDPMSYVHSPRFGEGLAAIARAERVPVTLRIGAGAQEHAELLRFLAAAVKR